jgi:hypothetical protein
MVRRKEKRLLLAPVRVVNSLGFTFALVSGQPAVPMDSVYRITLFVPHAEAIATVKFEGKGLEALTNESWGLDNVRVATANKADLASVPTIATKTVGDFVDQIQRLNPQNAALAVTNLERVFGIDLTGADKKANHARTSLAAVQKTDQTDVYTASFLTNIQFGLTQKGKADGDFLQIARRSVTASKDGKVTQQTTDTFVEAFGESKSQALALDSHYIASASSQFSFADADMWVIEANLVLGYGLYAGKLATTAPLHYSKFEGDAETAKVTWLSATRQYTVRFEVKKDGSWTFVDQSTGLMRAGKLGPDALPKP